MVNNFSLTTGERLQLFHKYRWWFVAAHTTIIKSQQFRPCNKYDAEAIQVVLGESITGVPPAMTGKKEWCRPVIVKRRGVMKDSILWACPHKINARRIWLNTPGGYVKRFRIVDCYVNEEQQQIFTKVLANGANTELQEQFKNDDTFWMQLKGND